MSENAYKAARAPMKLRNNAYELASHPKGQVQVEAIYLNGSFVRALEPKAESIRNITGRYRRTITFLRFDSFVPGQQHRRDFNPALLHLCDYIGGLVSFILKPEEEKERKERSPLKEGASRIGWPQWYQRAEC
ncbi:hypothetical protein KM043_012698 [Ampulex compressa]|nr:hypothetical protein KM043_012698 [Ampulex compressa]